MIASEGPVVALVEDDARLRASLVDLFESAGYLVDAFARAEELDDAELARFACVVSDIGLPGADGFALARRIMPTLPVILITGRDDLAVRAGREHTVFRKPFDGRALVAAVASAIRSQG